MNKRGVWGIARIPRTKEDWILAGVGLIIILIFIVIFGKTSVNNFFYWFWVIFWCIFGIFFVIIIIILALKKWKDISIFDEEKKV